MKYLDHTISYDYEAENAVYRIESEHQTCWHRSFVNAVEYVRAVWRQKNKCFTL